MKTLISSLSLVVAFLWSAVLPTNAQVNVTQKNNNLSRDGLYIDAAFTPANAANLTRDLNFDGTVVGNVHAQPLYIEAGPQGPMIIAVTASNNVYALDATDGSISGKRMLARRSRRVCAGSLLTHLALSERPLSILPRDRCFSTQ
jgi:hypothetical protein